ncbi:MAG: flagellar motor protein MotB [Prevotellaceae bacterium]|jgi:outer membrane protein OmpA-like peptidoglycan-associated protein|nr:flagellar motor protein MotB [Prevotellaceae bacterium]
MAKKGNYFWASYSDLMTSLFFIMLVLFVLTVSVLNQQKKEIKIKAEVFDKIKELEEGINKIDPNFFKYDERHKKHILKINVAFPKGSSDMNNIPYSVQADLIKAGKSIRDFIDGGKEYNAEYLLIIEGQASKDGYNLNDELSYNRALALKQFWNANHISFSSSNCEVIISGSGEGGSLRSTNEPENQRFLIHIILKPGLFNDEIKSEK